MKNGLEKARALKGAPWVGAVLLCAAALLLLPLPGKQAASGMTEEEQRISAALGRISGAGETYVTLYYAQAASAFGAADRTPVGAVIVARGAGNVAVRLKLAQAAETLLGLSASQVEVFAMEDAP